MLGRAEVNRESKPCNSARALGPKWKKKCYLSDSVTLSPQVHSQEVRKEKRNQLTSRKSPDLSQGKDSRWEEVRVARVTGEKGSWELVCWMRGNVECWLLSLKKCCMVVSWGEDWVSKYRCDFKPICATSQVGMGSQAWGSSNGKAKPHSWNGPQTHLE
jgi:hypothetical protein